MRSRNVFVIITGILSLVFLILAVIKMLDANTASMEIRSLNKSIQLMNAEQESVYTRNDLEKLRGDIRREEARYYQNPKEMFYSFAADSVAGAEERNLRVYETIAAEQSGISTWELMVVGSEASILGYLDDLCKMERYVVFNAVNIQRTEEGARARLTMYLPEVPEYDPSLVVEELSAREEGLKESWTSSRIAFALFRSFSVQSAPAGPLVPAPVQESNRTPSWIELVGRYREPSGRLVLALKDSREGIVYSLEEDKEISGWSIREQADGSVLLSIGEDSYILDLEQ